MTTTAFLSWGGFNLQGDEASIKEAQRLLHEAGKIPELMATIAELRAERSVIIDKWNRAEEALIKKRNRLCSLEEGLRALTERLP